MTDRYSDKQQDTLQGLTIAVSSLSFIGGTFIIVNYSLFPHLRTFAFKLIFFVAIGDIINSVGNFMGSAEGENAICQIQAFLTQFGDLTSFGWVTCIAWSIHAIFTSEKALTQEDAARWMTRMHFCVWGIAILFTVIPITEFGADGGGLCWISQKHTWGVVARMLFFYIPLWCCIGYMTYVYCKVWDKINAVSQERPQGQKSGVQVKNVNNGSSDNVKNNETNNENNSPKKERQHSESDIHLGDNANMSSNFNQSEESMSPKSNNHSGSTVSRMKYYPLILILCYLFATIRRLIEAITGNQAPFPIACLHVIFYSLLGTFNGLVYGLTPQVRETDMKAIRSCCNTGSPTFDDDTKHLTGGNQLFPRDRTESESNSGEELGGDTKSSNVR